MEADTITYPLVRTFAYMFWCINLARLHNNAGPYHFIKWYITIKHKRLARLLMCDWLSGTMRVKYYYPEYLNRLSILGLIGYILIGFGYLWVLWIIFIEKNPMKAYDYGINVLSFVIVFELIKRLNAYATIKHYYQLVKEGKIDIFGDQHEEE